MYYGSFGYTFENPTLSIIVSLLSHFSSGNNNNNNW